MADRQLMVFWDAFMKLRNDVFNVISYILN